MISYFSDEELKKILDHIAKNNTVQRQEPVVVQPATATEIIDAIAPQETSGIVDNQQAGDVPPSEDRSKDEILQAENTASDDELYSIKNFSV